MDANVGNSASEIDSMYAFNRHRGWIGDRTIQLEGWCVEHLQDQTHAELEVPSLSKHTIILVRDSATRQVSRFAGLSYDGVGRKDHFMLLPANTPALFAWEGGDEAIIFDIDPEALRKTAMRTESINPGSVQLSPLVLGEDEQIKSFANLLQGEIETGGLSSKLYSESLLTAFNIHLLRHYCVFSPKIKTYNGGLSLHQLHQVVDYISANLSSGDISLKRLAGLCELSEYHFARQFKRSTGLAPHQYVTKHRLEKAKQLLEQRKISIAQIAIDCGFSNQSHFGKVFRQAVGTTPKRYQRDFI